MFREKIHSVLSAILFFSAGLAPLSVWAANADYDSTLIGGKFNTWTNWKSTGYTGTETERTLRAGFNESYSQFTSTITKDDSGEYTVTGLNLGVHDKCDAELIIKAGKLTITGGTSLGGCYWSGRGDSTGKNTHTDTTGTLTIDGGAFVSGAVTLGGWNTDASKTIDHIGIANVNSGSWTSSGNIVYGTGSYTDGQNTYRGKGFLNVSGGTASLTGTHYVGNASGAYGEINLSGGTLTTGEIRLGSANSGSGTLNLKGGTLVLTSGNKLYVGYNENATGKLSVSAGEYTLPNLIFANGKNSNGTLEVTGTETASGTANVSGAIFGNATGSTGAVTVSGGTLNLTNSQTDKTQNQSVNYFGNQGNFEFTQTGGTVNNYAQIFTCENGGGNTTSTWNFSGGTFNSLAYSSTRELSQVGGGRVCFNSRGDATISISGSANLNLESETILSWGVGDTVVNQTGGTVSVKGANRVNCSGNGNGLGREGIVFIGNTNDDYAAGSATYNLSGGTLTTSRMSQHLTNYPALFTVSQATGENAPAASATVGLMQVAVRQTGGTLNVGTFDLNGNIMNGGTSATYSFEQTGGTFNAIKDTVLGKTGQGAVNISNGGSAYIGGDAKFNLTVTTTRRAADTADQGLTIGTDGTGTMTFAGNSVSNIASICVGLGAGSTGTLNITENATVNLINTQTGWNTPTMSLFSSKGVSNINITGGVLNNYGEIMSNEHANVASHVVIDGGTFNHLGWDSSRGTEKIGGGRLNVCGYGTSVWELKSGALNVTSEFLLNWGVNGSTTTFTQTGGTANIQGGNRQTINGGISHQSEGLQFIADGGGTGQAVYNLKGGTLTTPRMWANSTLSPNADSVFNLSGGTASVTSLEVYTTMTGGTLNATTVNLANTHKVGTTFVQQGGILSPGLDEFGIMTFQTPYEAEGTVTYHIDYNQETKEQDQILFSSTSNFTNADVIVELDLLGTVLDADSTLRLQIFGEKSQTVVDRAAVQLKNFEWAVPSLGYIAAMSSTGEITVSVYTPEPAAWLLLLLGLPLVWRVRKNLYLNGR